MRSKMGNKMGNKMGILLSWEFCTDWGIWVLGSLGYFGLWIQNDHLRVENLRSRAPPGAVELLPKPCWESGILIAPHKNMEWFRSEGTFKLIPFPFPGHAPAPQYPGNPKSSLDWDRPSAVGHLGWFFGQSQFSKAGSCSSMLDQIQILWNETKPWFRIDSPPTAFSLCSAGKSLIVNFPLFQEELDTFSSFWGIWSKLGTHTLKIPLFFSIQRFKSHWKISWTSWGLRARLTFGPPLQGLFFLPVGHFWRASRNSL